MELPREWVGRPPAQLDIRRKHRIIVLATKRGSALDPLPGPDHVFQSDERILILSSNEDAAKFLKY